MFFYWEQRPYKYKGIVRLDCYYTNKKRGKLAVILLVEEDRIEQTKHLFEADKLAYAVENGAWRPIEGAKWRFNGREWVIDDSQIELVT